MPIVRRVARRIDRARRRRAGRVRSPHRPWFAGLLAIAPITGTASGLENDELWDLYPARFEVRQFAGTTEAARADAPWFAFDPGRNTLTGVPLGVEVEDETGSVRFDLPGAGSASVDAGDSWQWMTISGGSFSVETCQFSFTQALGAVRLPFGEGFRLGQKETLAWTGLPGSCPKRLERYLETTGSAPVMPLHFGDWQAIGSPAPLSEAGRVEVAVITDLRRTRRLLPMEAPGEVDADPFNGFLPSMGEALARLALIEIRLGSAVFGADFEP